MSPPHLDKTYNAESVEARWVQTWQDQGHFTPDARDTRTPYTIVIPPPNVTGSLHIGHAFNATLQDILVRWRRMQGYNTLWLPGTDHAGIATQNVVERQLLAEGHSKEDLGRDAFIDRVWRWRKESGDTIIRQLKQLGASCDWTRQRFTMDEGLSKAVRTVFVSLHEQGLIYRGERLINWCPRCLTALSDIEVEHENIQGKLYHVRYSIDGEDDASLTVATTRPETMLGDTAVAVHPEDPRYNQWIGKTVRLPLTNRTIPIVADAILVDREFGTGAVKITPACDFNDEEAGQRLGLPSKPLFDYRARIDATLFQPGEIDATLAGTIGGQDAEQARTHVVTALDERGDLLHVEDHAMALGKCYRCKTVVMPFPSPQWFVRIQPLADPAIQAVETGNIRIIPEGWKNNYLGWMRNIKDWCISRQIWWGHQIPAWYCVACNRDHLPSSVTDHGAAQDHAHPVMSASIGPHASPVIAMTAPDSCAACGGTRFIQDPDVLDTWFSSALWPFSTLGWPDDHPDRQTFYPTAALVTGLDILFFWVARMIMMGLRFTDHAPFRDVYIHALVRDAEGQKMSKSKGNVIDPLTKMRQYGTDALRFTLASMASPGRDIKLSEGRIEGYRNFVTKIWNAARFIQLHCEGHATSHETADTCSVEDRSPADRWIISRLHRTVQACNAALEEYRFDHAASLLYQFIWHEYCDWYIELVKPALKQPDSPEAERTRRTLLETFAVIQRALHPFMPFVTEELWQTFAPNAESIVKAPFPTAREACIDQEAEATFALLESFVSLARTSRTLLNYSPHQTATFYGTTEEPAQYARLERVHAHLEHLAQGTITLAPVDAWPSTQVFRLVTGAMTVGIVLDQDVDVAHVLQRIGKQLQEKEKEAKRLEGRLASKDFTAKAEASVIQESQERLHRLQHELSLLTDSHHQLTTMSG